MKIFIKKVVIFGLLIILFIEIISSILIYTDLYLINYPGNEIYHSILKSKEKNKSKILLIGDSVGNQLFSNRTNNDSINSLACNQSIGIIGQYLLVNNYINTGNKIDTLIAIFNPFTLSNNLNQTYTFHYFLKPFDNSEYSALFSKTVKEQINKIPYHQFSHVPHILATSWAPEFNPPNQNDSTFLSPISIEYLIKIKKLAKQHNFKLIILPTPTSTENKHLIEKIDANEFKKHNLEQEFKDYFKKIIYLDSTYFLDGIHLKQPEIYTKIYKTEMMK